MVRRRRAARKVAALIMGAAIRPRLAFVKMPNAFSSRVGTGSRRGNASSCLAFLFVDRLELGPTFACRVPAKTTTINAGGTLDLGGFTEAVNSVSLSGGALRHGALT